MKSRVQLELGMEQVNPEEIRFLGKEAIVEADDNYKYGLHIESDTNLTPALNVIYNNSALIRGKSEIHKVCVTGQDKATRTIFTMWSLTAEEARSFEYKIYK